MADRMEKRHGCCAQCGETGTKQWFEKGTNQLICPRCKSLEHLYRTSGPLAVLADGAPRKRARASPTDASPPADARGGRGASRETACVDQQTAVIGLRPIAEGISALRQEHADDDLSCEQFAMPLVDRYTLVYARARARVRACALAETCARARAHKYEHTHACRDTPRTAACRARMCLRAGTDGRAMSRS